MPVFLDRTKLHAESGLYFEPPHERCFRFNECEGATLFQRYGIHEMDFGWWDVSQQAMCLLEVKDYSQPTGTSFNAEHFVNECIQKATDCLLILASIWYDLPYGPKARDWLPEEWHARPASPPDLHMFFVIKVPEPQNARPLTNLPGLNGLEDRTRAKLKGRLELFNIRPSTNVFVMDHPMAATRGLPIRTEQALLGAPETRGRARQRGNR